MLIKHSPWFVRWAIWSVHTGEVGYDPPQSGVLVAIGSVTQSPQLYWCKCTYTWTDPSLRFNIVLAPFICNTTAHIADRHSLPVFINLLTSVSCASVCWNLASYCLTLTHVRTPHGRDKCACLSSLHTNWDAALFISA